MCPDVIGLIVMKTTHLSSRKTKVPGISPLIIFVKRVEDTR